MQRGGSLKKKSLVHLKERSAAVLQTQTIALYCTPSSLLPGLRQECPSTHPASSPRAAREIRASFAQRHDANTIRLKDHWEAIVLGPPIMGAVTDSPYPRLPTSPDPPFLS